MVLPHSKSGNEPLENTLPPTRYFMVVHKGFEPFSNPYKELALTNVLMDCFGKRYGTRTHIISLKGICLEPV